MPSLVEELSNQKSITDLRNMDTITDDRRSTDDYDLNIADDEWGNDF